MICFGVILHHSCRTNSFLASTTTMASSNTCTRTADIVEHFESIGNGTRTRQDVEHEVRRAAEAANRLREVQEAPVVTAPVVSPKASALPPQVPPRPSGHRTRRHDTQQLSTPPTTPLRGSSLQDSQLQPSESESEPDSDRPPTPESPVTFLASRTPDSSTRPCNNRQAQEFLTSDPAVQRLQVELDGVKREIDQIKLQRDESDRKVDSLSAQLDEAHRRALEIDSQNAEMRREIRELNKSLRDARREEKKLNDEIRDMMRRERVLLDQLYDAQATHQEDASHERSRQKRSSKREDVEMVMVRPIPLRKKSGKRWIW